MNNNKRFFISNRLPLSINSATGEVQRGSGGLVSALLDVDLEQSFCWMGFEQDSESLQRMKEHSRSINKNLDVEPVLIDKKLYEEYYNKFSNDVLWPLFHYEGRYAAFSRKYWDSYRAANQLMADAILKLVGPTDSVWIHDFHFFLLPQMLKQKKPSLKIGFFLHIPFPSSEIFRQLPVREEILRGLAALNKVDSTLRNAPKLTVKCRK